MSNSRSFAVQTWWCCGFCRGKTTCEHISRQRQHAKRGTTLCCCRMRKASAPCNALKIQSSIVRVPVKTPNSDCLDMFQACWAPSQRPLTLFLDELAQLGEVVLLDGSLLRPLPPAMPSAAAAAGAPAAPPRRRAAAAAAAADPAARLRHHLCGRPRLRRRWGSLWFWLST